jgi:hypothetical protein
MLEYMEYQGAVDSGGKGASGAVSEASAPLPEYIAPVG